MPGLPLLGYASVRANYIVAADFNKDGKLDLLTENVNPVVAGQSATFTLTISPAPTGSPLGTVSFHNGGTLLGAGTVNGLPDSGDVFKVVPTGPGTFAAPPLVDPSLVGSLLGLTVDGFGNLYLLTSVGTGGSKAIVVLECAAPTGLGTCSALTTVPTTFTPRNYQ